MLVVVVIIGILAAFATMSIGNRALDDRLEVESRRLEQTMRLASEEAEAKGVEIGFRYTQYGYEFLATDKDGKWQPYAESGPLRGRTLATPFFAELHVEGRLVPPAVPAEEDKDKKIVPQLFLLSSGEVTAFAMDIKAENYAPHYHLEADTLGRFTLTRLEAGS
jgi:general secretion pathway protein H